MYTLIATIGTSPAVLTEAVYALHEQGLWPVEEVIIITTKTGAAKTRELLFGEGSDTESQWSRLCRALGIGVHDIRVPGMRELRGIPAGEGGSELEDVRNTADDARMAAFIQNTVRKITADPDRALIALLSGGRKTMSSHLMAAMQLFGRRQDRLIHILVPPEAETTREFFFPSEAVLNPATGLPLSKDRISIDLIDIPYLRLRPWLEGEMDYTQNFAQLLEAADQKLRAQEAHPVRSFVIDIGNKTEPLRINGISTPATLPPRQLALLCLFIWRNIRSGAVTGTSLRDIVEDEALFEALHIFYRTAKHGSSDQTDEEARTINLAEARDQDDWAHDLYWYDEKQRKLEKRSFPKERSELWKKLRQMQQAHPDLNTWPENHFFQDTDPPRKAAVDRRYVVSIPPHACRITGLHPDDARELGLD